MASQEYTADVNQHIAHTLDTTGFYEGLLDIPELVAIFPHIVTYLVDQCVARKHIPFLNGAVEHHIETLDIYLKGRQKEMAVTTEIGFTEPINGWLCVTFLITQAEKPGLVTLQEPVRVIEKVKGFWAKRAFSVLGVQSFLQQRLSQPHQVIEASLTESLQAQHINKSVTHSAFTFEPGDKIWVELTAQ